MALILLKAGRTGGSGEKLKVAACFFMFSRTDCRQRKYCFKGGFKFKNISYKNCFT